MTGSTKPYISADTRRLLDLIERELSKYRAVVEAARIFVKHEESDLRWEVVDSMLADLIAALDALDKTP